MAISLKPIEEQVIVIVGASSGFGLATAPQAAARRAKLVLTARSEGTLSDLVTVITAAGGEVVALDADVAVEEELRRVAELAIARFGRIDTWADAILAEATSPARDITVGLMAKLNTLSARFLPALGDQLSAKQVDRQRFDEPAPDREGTLYRPGQSGEIFGPGGAEHAAG